MAGYKGLFDHHKYWCHSHTIITLPPWLCFAYSRVKIIFTLIGVSVLIMQRKNTNNKTIWKSWFFFSSKVWNVSFLKVKCQDTLYSVDLGIDGGFSIIYADVWPLDSWSSISQPESVDLGSFYILLQLVLKGFVKFDTHGLVKIDTWISLIFSCPGQLNRWHCQSVRH